VSVPADRIDLTEEYWHIKNPLPGLALQVE
jgi:hypothetical protein